MMRLRISIFALLAWVLLFYAAVWLGDGSAFSAAANVLVPVTIVALAAIQRLRQVKPVVLYPILLAALVGAKLAMGLPLLGASLVVTLADAAALAITAWLAHRLANNIGEVETLIEHISAGPGGERRARAGEVYREIRRARAYHRPLSVLAVRHDGKALQPALDRVVLEAQRAMAKHYLLTSIGRALNSALDDYNIVARRGDDFIVLLPEMPAQLLGDTLQRLRNAGLEVAGVNLQVGAACLPDDATTLEGLIDKAMAAMRSDVGLAAAPAESASNLFLHGMAVVEVNDNGHADHQ